MSETVEGCGSVTVGDRVFVHPRDERAPLAVRGIGGTVVAVREQEAQVHVPSEGELVWVAAELLRPERRRRRPFVDWGEAASIDAVDERPCSHR